jgi:protein-S-isoprenylcysteine O-methyltransferase Ste14
MKRSKTKSAKKGLSAKATKAILPKSVTSFRINLIALVCLLVGLYCINIYQGPDFGLSYTRLIIAKMCFLMLCWSLPVIILEYFYFRRLKHFDHGRLDVRRALIKTMALYFTLSIVALVYWIAPEYHGSFYKPYWELLRVVLPVVLIGSLPYFYLTGGFIEDSMDSYSLLGFRILGARQNDDTAIIRNHFLGWLVKLFFLPLMTVYMYNTTRYFVTADPAQVFSNFRLFYQFAWELIFAIDLIIVTIGYLLTLKLLDSHIRTAEPTLGGWVPAIVCYEPFWAAVSASYLAYNKNNYSWGSWLGGNETGYLIWGSAILILITIYSLSSIAFGIRFSNLTHRGIITNGPYRYSKHPAYISKNLSWWLIAIPFIVVNDNYTASLQACLMLLGVNAIYYMRAKTEERHLSWDETYQQYAQAIEQQGLFAKVKRVFV